MDYKLKSGNILRVIHDESPESPREWDNLGKMICSHGNYTLGDKQIEGKLAQMRTIARDLNIEDYIKGLDKAYLYEEDKLEEFINNKEGAVVIKLFLYDHSGITMHMYQASCRWDSSMVGYIYVSKERIIEEYGDASPESVEKARGVLESEVRTYAQYLEGDIYGFKVIKKDICSLGHEHEEVLDSCWGFYGSDPSKNGMLDHIDDELLIAELV